MSQTEVLKYFATWIERETGIVYEEQNLYQLADRLETLAKHFKLGSTHELWQKAQGGISGEFRQLLVDIATNNETSFFRDAKFYECLEASLLPKLLDTKRPLQDLQVWSVASSTGQEPYTLAMLLSELAEKVYQKPPKILATDISTRVLEKAREGRYSDLEIRRGMPERLLAKYFKKDAAGLWTLDSKIRGMVDFQQLNLRTPFAYAQSFDLVLCRNVLIYQRLSAKIDIIQRLAKHIRPGGVFLLGSGESLLGLSNDFQQSLVDGVAVYTRKVGQQNAA